MKFIRLIALVSAPSYALGQTCEAFRPVSTPAEGQPGNVITAMSANAITGFAVGRSYPRGSGPFTPFLYRLRDDVWVFEALPPIPSPGTDPVLMSAFMLPGMTDEGWVVGWVTVPPTTNNLPLIARWRDERFDRVDLPQLRPQTEYPFGPRSGFGYDVVATAPDDAWVVGQANGFGDAVASSVAMALHWDGSGWEDVPTRIVASRSHSFDAVSASSSHNAWAVGYSRNIGQAFYGMIQRWDGSSWQVVEHPALSLPGSQFHDVRAFSATDVWVAGAVNYTDPLLYHWNGAQWESVALPDGHGVLAFGGNQADRVWVTTTDVGSGVYVREGDAWVEVETPAPPTGGYNSLRAISVIGECDVHVAGATINVNGFLGTLALRTRTGTPGCMADFNDDGSLTSQDFFDFLAAFFAGNADINKDAATNSQDFFDFLGFFFEGC